MVRELVTGTGVAARDTSSVCISATVDGSVSQTLGGNGQIGDELDHTDVIPRSQPATQACILYEVSSMISIGASSIENDWAREQGGRPERATRRAGVKWETGRRGGRGGLKRGVPGGLTTHNICRVGATGSSLGRRRDSQLSRGGDHLTVNAAHMRTQGTAVVDSAPEREGENRTRSSEHVQRCGGPSRESRSHGVERSPPGKVRSLRVHREVCQKWAYKGEEEPKVLIE